jgi:hypothetical protein
LEITAVAPTTIIPMPDAAQHALAATWALTRAQFLLNPVGIPEDPPKPDVIGARDAFQEAAHQLEQALQHAGGRPGHRQIEAALEEAQEALMYLARPGVNPPVAMVAECALRGGELAREALNLLHETGDVWPMG